MLILMTREEEQRQAAALWNEAQEQYNDLINDCGYKVAQAWWEVWQTLEGSKLLAKRLELHTLVDLIDGLQTLCELGTGHAHVHSCNDWPGNCNHMHCSVYGAISTCTN